VAANWTERLFWLGPQFRPLPSPSNRVCQLQQRESWCKSWLEQPTILTTDPIQTGTKLLLSALSNLSPPSRISSLYSTCIISSWFQRFSTVTEGSAVISISHVRSQTFQRNEVHRNVFKRRNKNCRWELRTHTDLRVRLTFYGSSVSRFSRKCWSLDVSPTCGLLRPVTGIALPYARICK
jgi:hypothetical protein